MVGKSVGVFPRYNSRKVVSDKRAAESYIATRAGSYVKLVDTKSAYCIKMSNFDRSLEEMLGKLRFTEGLLVWYKPDRVCQDWRVFSPRVEIGAKSLEGYKRRSGGLVIGLTSISQEM